ncbi:MAG: cobalamin biosynthesis protein CbiL [Desulfovibrio sp.]|nr:cobalamin biosynthesis protein CbiL [Desulfovibrio sp.]
MKNALRLLAAFVLAAILCPHAAWGHRVNIFAWTEAGTVEVQCGFGKNSPARNSSVKVFDAEDGTELASGTTDETGRFSFPIPQVAKAHGLRILLDAGEGHRNEWKMAQDEFSDSSAPATSSETPATTNSPREPSPARGEPESGDAQRRGLTEARLRAVIGQELDSRLAPIKRALAEQKERGPELRDIIGGVGWLIGIAGIVLAMRRKRA